MSYKMVVALTSRARLLASAKNYHVSDPLALRLDIVLVSTAFCAFGGVLQHDIASRCKLPYGTILPWGVSCATGNEVLS